ERVEPATRVVQRLADEVRGEPAPEAVLVLERRVVLREGHRARVEPHVDDRGHAVHRLAALRAWERHLDAVVAVRVGKAHAGELLELLERAYAVHVAALAAPQRQRRPPVALPGQRPVDVAIQPLAEPPVVYVSAVPFHGPAVPG